MARKSQSRVLRRKPNTVGKLFNVVAALQKRGESFAYAELSATGKVKVIK